MSIVYKQGSLFNSKAPILAHACNCMGVWGAGIAAAMKQRYVHAFYQYNKACHTGIANEGSYYLTEEVLEDEPRILCLMTSYHYGSMTSTSSRILSNTQSALEEFCKEHPNAYVASNKFNSGLFHVPWEATEKVLEGVLLRYPNITWEVWELKHYGVIDDSSYMVPMVGC